MDNDIGCIPQTYRLAIPSMARYEAIWNLYATRGERNISVSIPRESAREGARTDANVPYRIAPFSARARNLLAPSPLNLLRLRFPLHSLHRAAFALFLVLDRYIHTIFRSSRTAYFRRERASERARNIERPRREGGLYMGKFEI